MEFLNSQYFMIGVVVVVALVCYMMWKEVKKTQVDITGLKTFSGKVAEYIESNQQKPVTVAVTPAASQEVAKEPEVIEEKKE